MHDLKEFPVIWPLITIIFYFLMANLIKICLIILIISFVIFIFSLYTHHYSNRLTWHYLISVLSWHLLSNTIDLLVIINFQIKLPNLVNCSSFKRTILQMICQLTLIFSFLYHILLKKINQPSCFFIFQSCAETFKLKSFLEDVFDRSFWLQI